MGVLGDTPPGEFLRDYWQRQPLVIRDAVPDYRSPVSADQLAGLALDSDVESRLVLEYGANRPWELQHGPLDASDFAELPKGGWTLLVQAVDLWVPETKSLMRQFDFLPQWRFDDIMVSYAVPGGSVGPHFDQYDVFLLQVEGERQWQVGPRIDGQAELIEESDLRILKHFEPVQEWTLRPGDMLYLPPRVSHWGVATTECMTYSIGFRSPTLSELLGDLAVELLTQDGDVHYSDPPLVPAMAAEEIDPEFIEHTRQLLLSALDDNALLTDWFARHMTTPKYPDLEDVTGEHRRASINGVVYENGAPRS